MSNVKVSEYGVINVIPPHHLLDEQMQTVDNSGVTCLTLIVKTNKSQADGTSLPPNVFA